MTWMRRSVPFVLLGLVVAVVTFSAVDARATYGAQTTADEPQYLLSAVSVVEDGDLDISDELAAERFRVFHEADLPQQTEPFADGRRISPHDPLLPVLLALPMGVGGWVGAKAALAMAAGALAALLAWTAHRRLGVRLPVAMIVTALATLSPPLAVYATQVYPEIVAATAVTAAIASLTGPAGRARWMAAAAVVALPWLAVKYVPVAAVLAIALLVRSDRRRRFAFVAWFAASGVVYAAGHLLIYGGLTPYAAGDHFVGGEFTAVGTGVDLWGRATRLVGLMVDGGFGIAAWQPMYLLAPLAMGWLCARSLRHGSLPRTPETASLPASLRVPAVPDRFAGVLLPAVLGVGWLTATFVALTMHGWWFPGRQLVVVLPAAVLMVATWADRGRYRLAAAVATGGAGVAAFAVLAVAGTAGDITWVVDFAATSDPLRRLASAALPDYMAPSPRTWVLHGAWSVALAAAMVGGWVVGRGPAAAKPEDSSREEESSQEREKVMT